MSQYEGSDEGPIDSNSGRVLTAFDRKPNICYQLNVREKTIFLFFLTIISANSQCIFILFISADSSDTNISVS